jgi:hypothetical protein
MRTLQPAFVMAATLVFAGQPLTAADTSGSVPPSWTAFATQVAQHLQTDLANTQDPIVRRLHQYLDAEAAKDPNTTPPAPVMRLWFARSGSVRRVEFLSLGNPQADQDLRQVVTSTPIGSRPPADMRQPLVLRIRLTYPSPSNTASTSPSSPPPPPQ